MNQEQVDLLRERGTVTPSQAYDCPRCDAVGFLTIEQLLSHNDQLHSGASVETAQPTAPSAPAAEVESVDEDVSAPDDVTPPALSYDCPSCGAGIGDKCKSDSGKDGR